MRRQEFGWRERLLSEREVKAARDVVTLDGKLPLHRA